MYINQTRCACKLYPLLCCLCIFLLVWPVDAIPAVFVKVAGQTLQYKGQRYYLHGVNYYPQRTPWSLFWPQYNPATTAQDLKRIQQLGFNTVRIFVPYGQFGGKHLLPAYTARLSDFLAQADRYQIKVIVTLFDFFTDYHNLPESQQHLKQLIPIFANHPAILAWDLKNEGDSDYKYGKSKVIHWVKQITNTVRQWDRQHLLTAGWSAPETVPDIAPYLDYVTFHDYRDEGQLATAIKRLQQQVRQPIVLGEYGFHTWPHKQPDPHYPEHQYNYINAVLFASLHTDLAGSLVWGMYDFPPRLQEPFVLTGESVQYHMGILDIYGKPKAGVAALQQFAFLVDAVTQRAIDSRTHRIAVGFRLAKDTPVRLMLRQGSKDTLQFIWNGKKGVNRFEWPIASERLQDLLSLRQTYVLQAPSLLNINGQVDAAGSHLLKIRER